MTMLLAGGAAAGTLLGKKERNKIRIYNGSERL